MVRRLPEPLEQQTQRNCADRNRAAHTEVDSQEHHSHLLKHISKPAKNAEDAVQEQSDSDNAF